MQCADLCGEVGFWPVYRRVGNDLADGQRSHRGWGHPRWLDARYDDVVRYCQLPAGGHFAALEQPAALVEEIRTTFRGLR